MGNSLDKYLKDPEVNKLRPQCYFLISSFLTISIVSKLELYMLALLFRDLSGSESDFLIFTLY